MAKVMKDPITGPLSREDFRSLWDAPYGEALEAIRKHDPLYGRKPGEKIRWRVTLKREVPEIGTATVIAATEEEATQLADKLTDAEIDWDVDDCYADADGIVEKVEPEGGRIFRRPSAFPLLDD